MYDFPLRRDLITRIVLPIDLTPADAERLVRFVLSLVIEEKP